MLYQFSHVQTEQWNEFQNSNFKDALEARHWFLFKLFACDQDSYSITVRLETAPKSNLPYEKENAFQKDQKLRISITNEDILKILYPRNPRRVSASSIKWFQTNVDCFRFTCKTDFLSVKYEASVN